MKLLGKSFSVYIPSTDISNRIVEMGRLITQNSGDRELIFLVVLNGSFVFAADLVRAVPLGCKVTFIRVASYDGMQSSGKITELLGLSEDISGKDVILVEDIIDTGYTISYILDMLNAHKPASVKIATLLLKREALKVRVEPDYVGFEITNRFVVGYGLDYDGYGRNLPHIYQAV